MARYRGRHRAPTNTGRLLARTAIAGAAIGAPLAVAPAASAETGGTVWDKLAQCESSGNWAINTGNGFSGGLQFTPGTWRAFGGVGVAHHASREQQIAVAERVLAEQGWGAWPACSRKLGLRGKPAPIHAAPQARPSTTAAPVPSGGPGDTVTVVAGDTLSSIASAHGIAGGWTALRDVNPNLRNPNVLSIGTVIRLR
jgi:resuscitation-promoting factor RpfA